MRKLHLYSSRPVAGTGSSPTAFRCIEKGMQHPPVTVTHPLKLRADAIPSAWFNFTPPPDPYAEASSL